MQQPTINYSNVGNYNTLSNLNNVVPLSVSLNTSISNVARPLNGENVSRPPNLQNVTRPGIPTASINVARPGIPTASINVARPGIPTASINVARPGIPTASINVARPGIPSAARSSIPTPSINGSQPPIPAPSINGSRPSIPTAPINGSRPSIPTVPINVARPSIPNVPINVARPSIPTVPINGSRPSIPTVPINGSRPAIPTVPINVTPIIDVARPAIPTVPINVTPIIDVARPTTQPDQRNFLTLSINTPSSQTSTSPNVVEFNTTNSLSSVIGDTNNSIAVRPTAPSQNQETSINISNLIRPNTSAGNIVLPPKTKIQKNSAKQKTGIISSIGTGGNVITVKNSQNKPQPIQQTKQTRPSNILSTLLDSGSISQIDFNFLSNLKYKNGDPIIVENRPDIILTVLGMLKTEQHQDVEEFLNNIETPQNILWDQKSMDEGRIKVAREITIQQTEETGISGVGKCRYCPSTELVYATKQLRSGDEPATIFVRCVMCTKQWRE